jgi:hypothetical protein
MKLTPKLEGRPVNYDLYYRYTPEKAVIFFFLTKAGKSLR